ncbi:MAG: DUF115 domain-containing protein [Leptospiraceae bacterium]|nr:motility associated factor glycosyltransferase family protein [Leptospiraceae bacterium]MCK6382239.1 DUF115 domain-containing protein [Leptospiraceae bacterium]NUM40589.1 motility associated factor glycosyltransferase family protein [Leptospiraceae bacterium]
MSLNQFEEIFRKKPYLKFYFSEKPSETHNAFSIQEASKKGEYFVSYKNQILASSVSPLTQAKRLINEKKISDNSVVVILGSGNPHTMDEINNGLREGQIVLIIEESEELFSLLWDKFLIRVAEVPGRHIFFGEKMVSLLWNYLDSLPIEKLSGVVVLKNQSSIQLNKNFYDTVEEKIKNIFSSKMSDLLTKFEFERIWVKNSIVNICNFYDSKIPRYKFQELEKSFSNIPALLVSAGPSLRKNIDFIKSVREKVFLFSCDTSLKVLNKFDIIPDGVMTLDAQTHSFFHFLGEDLKTIPIFADLVASPPLLRNLNSISIVHSVTSKFQVDASGKPIRETTAGGDTSEKLLGKFGDVQSGGSVATTAFDALRIMGFSPIFLIGQDLAYTGREIHSTGTHHNEKWLTLVSRKKSLEYINESIIRKRTTYKTQSCVGGEVLTDYVLDLYKHWFEESSKTVDFPVYNINENGSNIENTVSVSTKEAEKLLYNYGIHNFPWKNLPPWKESKSVQKDKIHISKNTFINELNEFKNLIENLENLQLDDSEFLNELKLKLNDLPYLKEMIRKTEIYLLRHEKELDPEKKKKLLSDSLRKEILFLKRGLLSNAT